MSKYENCEGWTREILKAARFLQNERYNLGSGRKTIKSEELNPGKWSHEIKAKKSGAVHKINIKILQCLQEFLEHLIKKEPAFI